MKKQKVQVVQKLQAIKRVDTKKLDIHDLRLFKTIISKINTKDTLFGDWYQVSYDDLDEAGYVSNRAIRRKALDHSLNKLASSYVTFETEEEIRVTGIITNNWIHKKNTSIISIHIQPHMKEFLLDIKDSYFKYPLELLANFKSKYEILLFENLQSIKRDKTTTQKIKVQTFREMMNISDDKYKNTGTLKKEVIDKCIKRINDYSDINATVKIEKEGKKVKYFIFTVTKKDTRETFGQFAKRVTGKKIIFDNAEQTIEAIEPKDYGEWQMTLSKEVDGIKMVGKLQAMPEEQLKTFIEGKLEV